MDYGYISVFYLDLFHKLLLLVELKMLLTTSMKLAELIAVDLISPVAKRIFIVAGT